MINLKLNLKTMRLNGFVITEQMIIDRYLGIPYAHKGEGAEGFDCWTFVKDVYGRIGVKLEGVESYEEHWSRKGKNYFIENYHQQWEKTSHPGFLDVALFFNSHQVANHCGLILTAGRFIHCARETGIVVSELSLNLWKNRLEGIYRFRGFNGHN